MENLLEELPKLAKGSREREKHRISVDFATPWTWEFFESVSLETISPFLSSGLGLSDDSDDESVVYEQSSYLTKADKNEIAIMNADEVAKLLPDHTEKLATHQQDQMATLTKVLQQSNETPKFLHANSVSMPKYLGQSTEDGNEFLLN